MSSKKSEGPESRRDFMRRSLSRLVRYGTEVRETVNNPAVRAPSPVKAPPPAPAAPRPPSSGPVILNQLAGMAYEKLGRTGLMASRIAAGAAGLRPGQEDVLRAAIDRGVNLLEAGLSEGESEIVVARALEGRRDRAWVVTKTPPIEAAAAGEPIQARERTMARVYAESLDSSLARLGVDAVDIHLINAPESPDALWSLSLREAVTRARAQGKIRFSGVSVVKEVMGVLDAAVQTDHFDALFVSMSPFNYTSLLPWFDRAKFKGIGFVARDCAAVLQPQPEGGPPIRELPPELTPEQMILLYMLRHSPAASVSIQPRSMEDLDRLLPLADMKLGVCEGNELDGLVYEDLWPVCEVCGQRKAFSPGNLESAFWERLAEFDRSGTLLPIAAGFESICEECEAARRSG